MSHPPISALQSVTSPVLPPELFNEVIKHLPLPDQRTACLLSQSTRKLALRHAYETVKIEGYGIEPMISSFGELGKDLKEVVRSLHIKSNSFDYHPESDRRAIFTLLPSLVSLQSLTFAQDLAQLVQPAELANFFDTIRSLPLRELRLTFGNYRAVEGPIPVGLAGLKTLDIVWQPDDSGDSGSRLVHLYGILEPSLPTLVELRIVNDPDGLRPDVDLSRLQGAGETLRSFEYELQSLDEGILDEIPKIFPNLTTLKIKWSNTANPETDHSVLWKPSHIKSLAKNTNLIDLELSSDFEVDTDDTVRADEDIVWFVRCYERRLKATRELAFFLPNLRQCNWLQLRIGKRRSSKMLHPFVIEERGRSKEADIARESSKWEQLSAQKERVVRGVKQDWMGRNHDDWVGESGVVRCKLEDLPGDIIGENDSDADEEL